MTRMQGIRSRLLAVIAFVLAVAALRQGYPVIMPLVVAIFVIAAAWPVKPWFERVLPSSLSYVATVLALFILVACIIAVVYFALAQLAQTFGAHEEQFRSLYNAYETAMQQRGLPAIGGEGGYERLASIARVLFWQAYSFLGYLGIVAVLVVMGLPEVPTLAAKFRDRLGRGENRELIDTVEKIAGKFRRYIGMTVVTSLITAVASALWAYAVGLDLAVMWGLLNFLLNFIPVVGNIIGILPPTLYAIIQFEGWTMPLVVFAGFAVLQITISNVIYPMLQGRGMAMPPVAIIVALLFWGWAWGIVGALLAVPLTAAIVIICEHFKSTKWVAGLLSRGED